MVHRCTGGASPSRLLLSDAVDASVVPIEWLLKNAYVEKRKKKGYKGKNGNGDMMRWQRLTEATYAVADKLQPPGLLQLIKSSAQLKLRTNQQARS